MKGKKQSTEPCIYCDSKAPRTKREHVLPQALGTFEQNWTLDCVCDDCDHFFSRELELALGRDSAEAFLRVETGVKPATAAARFLNRRMKAKLNSKGTFDGAHVVTKPTEEGDGTHPVLPPQVGFRSPGGPWQYILEAQLNEESISRTIHGPVEVEILGRGDDLVRLSQRLATLGVNFVQTYKLLHQPIATSPFPLNTSSTWIGPYYEKPRRLHSITRRRFSGRK